MKKILILCSLLFLVTGCSIKYDLRIDSNLSVKETITIKENNDVLKIYNSDLKKIPKDRISEYKNVDGFKQMNLEKEIFENNQTGGIVSANYTSLKDYKKSGTVLSLFSNISITDLGNTTNVQITDYNSQSFFEPEDTNTSMENIEVNIRFHNKIIDSNAKTYDEKTNTYTWLLTSDISSGNILFSIDNNSKRYDIIIQDFLNDNKYTLIIMGIILAIAFITFSKYYINNKKVNKI